MELRRLDGRFWQWFRGLAELREATRLEREGARSACTLSKSEAKKKDGKLEAERTYHPWQHPPPTRHSTKTVPLPPSGKGPTVSHLSAQGTPS